MKKLIYTAPLLISLLASNTWAAITEVASQRATGTVCLGASSCTAAFPNNVTAGNLLVVSGAISDGETLTPITVTDSVGTSYTTILCSPTGSTVNPFLSYGLAGGSGANTVTVDPNPAVVTEEIVSVDEFTGVNNPPLDVDGGSTTGTSTTPADSITTGVANALVIGDVVSGSASAWAPGSGYTQIGEDQSSNGFNFEFQIVTTAQAYSVDWTSSNIAWSACTASFKPTVATSFGPSRRRQQ